MAEPERLSSLIDASIDTLRVAAERTDVVRTGARNPIHPEIRKLVLKRDRFRCAWCYTTHPGELLNLDHIVPWSAGGTDHTSNLRLLCPLHNETRSNYRTDAAYTRRLACAFLCLACVRYTNAEVTIDDFDRDELRQVFCGHCNTFGWVPIATFWNLPTVQDPAHPGLGPHGGNAVTTQPMNQPKPGDRVRATLGESVLLGEITSIGDSWVDLRVDGSDRTNAIGLRWQLEVLPPPLPPEPPVRWVVRAVQGHLWSRSGGSWVSAVGAQREWGWLNEHCAPLTVLAPLSDVIAAIEAWGDGYGDYPFVLVKHLRELFGVTA